ncbi:MAG: U32 family peptidase C-terminal domain-containing protein, partial [Desulfatitalea sp.]
YYEAPEQFAPAAHWQQELDKITSRGYCTGFYLDDPDETLPQYQAPTAAPNPLVAKVLFAAGANKAHVEVRNQIRLGDGVEIVHPKGPPIPDRIQKIVDLNGLAIGLAQPGSRVTLHLSNDCARLDLLRHCVV